MNPFLPHLESELLLKFLLLYCSLAAPHQGPPAFTICRGKRPLPIDGCPGRDIPSRGQAGEMGNKSCGCSKWPGDKEQSELAVFSDSLRYLPFRGCEAVTKGGVKSTSPPSPPTPGPRHSDVLVSLHITQQRSDMSEVSF